MKIIKNYIIFVLISSSIIFCCEGKQLPLPSYTPDIRNNTSPLTPYQPSPVDGSIKQPVILTLSWKCFDPESDVIKYDVYFGVDSTDFDIIAQSNPDTFWVMEDTLQKETEYFWKILAKDIYGLEQPGPVWNFTTHSVENITPEVFISSPANGSNYYTGETVDFAGYGTDPEEGNLPDTSLNWDSSIDGYLWKGPSFSVNDLTEGTHTISLRGHDSKGLADTVSIQVTIIVPPLTPPTAEILFPSQDYQVFLSGQTISFQAQGSDPFETLQDSAFAWTSDVAGALGTGRTLPLNNLSVGTHRIILTVSDSEGFEAKDTVFVSISLPDNQAPLAYFYFTSRILVQSGTSSASVTLNATGSYDSEDLNNLYFKWDYDNDGEWDTGFTTENTVSVDLTLQSGKNYVRLLVRDHQGSEDETVRIVPEMILVPAGSFKRGSDPAEGNSDERPEQEITISGFYLDKFEVTNAQYAVFLNDGNIDHFYVEMKINENGSGKFVPMKGYENHPVSYVNWFDAKSYLEWLNSEIGLSCRFPTEAEWEKAARGGIYLDASNSISNLLPERDYPWGATFDSNKAHYSGNTSEYLLTAPVGHYSGKSPYGIYDLAGNVTEWVSDWYSTNYYSEGETQNPQGPGSGFYRVLRGGSYMSDSGDLRVSKRASFFPGMRGASYGIRCAVSE